jgi:uncharacterized protein (DUF58 family)
MHPLAALNEAELGSLTRVADRLLNTRYLLSRGNRPNRLQAGSGIEFLDHHEFSPGDDIRNIDWRVTARSRYPQIRRYCDEAAADWFIALDCSASMAIGDGEKWALAVQCAAAMAYLLVHLDNRVSILLFSNRVEQMVPLGRGYTHYASMLQTLRRVRPPAAGGGSDLRCCVSRIRHHSPVFVISDFLTDDSMKGGLDALSIRGDRLHALQILTSRDYQVPALTSARFKDVETGETITTDLGNDEQQRYRLAFKDYCGSLARHCRKQRIRFSRHMANEDWKSAVAVHLRQRNGQS